MQDLSLFNTVARNSKEGQFSLRTRATVMAELNNRLQSIKGIISGVYLFVMMLAGMNIFNTLMFSLKERTNEIGIKKALGASNEDILLQFILEAIFIGTIGAIVGIVLSLIFGIFIWKLGAIGKFHINYKI